VAAYSNDLGNSHEARSGYFDTPWDWAAIRANAGFIIQLGSRDDLLVPFAAQQEAADALGSTFYRYGCVTGARCRTNAALLATQLGVSALGHLNYRTKAPVR
jgi:hypothetical protein